MFITRNHVFIQLSRLDKPTGIWLVMFPCWWGVALSNSPWKIDFYLNLILFFIGAVCMRGAGCIVNDLTDRKFDREVERTRNRPLVSGKATPKQAILYFIFLCLGGGMVFLCLSPLGKLLSLFAFVLLIIYPWMKRITHWPQFVLGLAFNSGVLIAYANTTQTLNSLPWFVYGAGILWTLAYDTIYAFQDIEDDLKVGVKSTAILFRNNPKLLPIISYAGMIMIFIILGIQNNFSIYYWVGMTLFSGLACYFSWQWNPDDPASSFKIFKRNQLIGWVVFLSFTVS
jgi:4-hydroxybenzoate polyprenyltransferase